MTKCSASPRPARSSSRSPSSTAPLCAGKKEERGEGKEKEKEGKKRGEKEGRDRRGEEKGVVFGSPIADYQLTQVKLARMAVSIQGARQFAYAVARMMAKGEGALEASMVKAYVCKAAEWVTREAMQVHGCLLYTSPSPRD